MVIKVHVYNVIVCIFEIQNSTTLARNNISSYRNKFLVAAILLYKKQQKIEIRPQILD